MEWACVIRDQKEIWKVGVQWVSDLYELRLGAPALSNDEVYRNDKPPHGNGDKDVMCE